MPFGQMTFEQIVAQAQPYSVEVPYCWGSTLVVAPHPDDESLGCGGAIALLKINKNPIHVLFISDGSMSHPHSKLYPREARIKLREQETLNALEILGLNATEVSFLRLPDTQVPTAPISSDVSNDLADPSQLFLEAVAAIRNYLRQIRPQTILVPWRRDPHGDHRASWQLTDAAVREEKLNIRWLEYPIWVWESKNAKDLPTGADGSWFKLDIRDVLSQKRQAIQAHVSQITRLIDDDTEGFVLSPDMISHFTQAYEYYLKP